MAKSPKRPVDPADVPGLRCWRCGHDELAVLYTRRTRGGKVVRRRQCRKCRTRMTTWERMIGA